MDLYVRIWRKLDLTLNISFGSALPISLGLILTALSTNCWTKSPQVFGKKSTHYRVVQQLPWHLVLRMPQDQRTFIICDMWKGHHEKFLNSSKGCGLKKDVLHRLKSCTDRDASFTCSKGLKNCKVCGHDGLHSEHFKYGSDWSHVLLCLLVNAMILQGYIC